MDNSSLLRRGIAMTLLAARERPLTRASHFTGDKMAKKRMKKVLTEMKPPELVCSMPTSKWRACHAGGEPQPIDQFVWYEVSQRWSKMCLECRLRNREYGRTWREKHPEEAGDRSRAWREEHGVEYQRKWDRAHIKDIREDPDSTRYDAYKKKNRDKFKKKMTELRKDPVAYAAFVEKQRLQRIARFDALSPKKQEEFLVARRKKWLAGYHRRKKP